MKNTLQTLKSKGLVQDTSDETTISNIPAGTHFYCGFDPTATSLQLGNLVPLILSIHLARAGLKPIILFGGATGLIGDPSGKSQERPLLELETIKRNIDNQMQQVRSIMQRAGISEIMFVNNWDWTQGVSILEFLRDVGKHFTINYMLAKDSVKNRIESGGISFTEFSYMLLQSFDYLHLFKNYNCKLQIGGSDQWGNITAGLELIRKKLAAETSALSIPLLTNSQGKKFGKSEGGAIWLDPEQTSPYKLYQYLLNVGDQDALKYLRMLTFLQDSELQQISTESQNKPEERIAQQYLAKELCRLIHGEEATTDAIKSSSVLFSGELDSLSPAKIKEIFSEVPSTSISCEKTKSLSLADLLVEAGLAKSKGEARRLVAGGGAYLNEKRILDASESLSAESLSAGSILIFRAGKKNYALLELI